MATTITPIPNPPPSPAHGPPTILYAGLNRMGSLSLAHALASLDIRTHHFLETPWSDWAPLERIADATFGSGKHTSRSPAEWRELFEPVWGGFDATSDIAGFYFEQLWAAYGGEENRGGGAKVILVQREFESWWKSFESEVAGAVMQDYNPVVVLWSAVIGPLTGVPAPGVMRKTISGWFGEGTLEGVRRVARRRYEEHYAMVRRVVPRERLLEFNLQEGWGPLCEYLGKEVPRDGRGFPRLNDVKEHRRRTGERAKLLGPLMWERNGWWVMGLAVVGLGCW